ncbi:MAG TPA: hypothetical protein VKT83_05500 [bacterium]|nr:hypothetical protein [bacterium]
MPKVPDPYSVSKTKKLVADRRPSRKARVLMLRACSFRIVRSVGCAALTLLLAAVTYPAFGASTARDLESLSAADRASLPDATLIKLKIGATVSLGVLRSEHKLRLQRFATAAKLGALQLQTLLKSEKNEGSLTPLPMNFSRSSFKVSGKEFVGPFPADFLAFCKGAAATACLYLPIAVYYSIRTNYVDFDALITDSKVCQSEGGVAKYGGCNYHYPIQYGLTFKPGKPTAQGYPVTQSAACPSPFTYAVDPRGAVSLNARNFQTYSTYGAYGWTWSVPNSINVTKLASCVVRVFVKK